jgi:hypothetical protein
MGGVLLTFIFVSKMAKNSKKLSCIIELMGSFIVRCPCFS